MRKSFILLVFLAFPPISSADEPKLLNLRFEPHWLLLKEGLIDAQFRMSEKISFGPVLGYMANGSGIYSGFNVAKRLFYDDKTDRLTLGVRAALYFNSVDDNSLYVSGMARYSKSKIIATSIPFFFSPAEPERTGEFKEITLGITTGYQWVVEWFTFNAGLGLAHFIHPEKIRLTASGGSFPQDYTLSDDKYGLILDAGIGIRF